MTTVTSRQKIDRGVKRRCAACATLFYDLLHYPIQCPKCGATFNVNARVSSPASVAKRSKATASRANAKKTSSPAAKSDEPNRRKPQNEDAELEQSSDQDELILDREDEDEDA